MHGSMYMCFGCASSCQRAAWQLCQAEPCVSWPTSTGPSCPTQMKASHNRGFTSLSLSLFLSHSLSLSISLSSSGPVLCPGMHGPCTTEVNEYPALPRTVNTVAVTALHAVRDAKIVGVPAVADKCPPTAIRAQCRAPPREQQDESPLSRPLHPLHLRHPFPHSIPLTARTIHRGEQLDGHLGTRACLRCTPTTTWSLTKSDQGLPSSNSALTATSPGVRQRLTVLKMLW